MKHLILFCLSAVLLTGCMTENTLNGYSQSKLDEILVTKDLADEGHYGVCKFYVPPEKRIEDRLPLVIYFEDEKPNDGANSIIEYVDKENNPAIVLIVPYGTNDYERALISQGVEDYVTSKLRTTEFAIHPHQIYVTGFGAGGMEAWKFATENTGWVATVATVCSGPPSGKVYNEPEVPVVMTEMNIWAVQYVDDPIVNNDYFKKVVTAIWTQNLSMCRFTEFFEGGHTTAPFKQRAFLDWMFGTRLSHGISGVENK